MRNEKKSALGVFLMSASSLTTARNFLGSTRSYSLCNGSSFNKTRHCPTLYRGWRRSLAHLWNFLFGRARRYRGSREEEEEKEEKAGITLDFFFPQKIISGEVSTAAC